MQREGRSCRGNRALGTGNDEVVRSKRPEDAGIAKLKRAENDGEMPRSSWSRACLCLCFVEGAAAIKYLQRL